MLFIKTKLLPSQIHGLGLFADQFIPKGTVVCEFIEMFDQVFGEKYFSSDQFSSCINLAYDLANAYIIKHGYFNNKFWHLNADNAKFLNHSDQPNLMSSFADNCDRAARDIQIGEELTCNYYSFDEKAAEKLVIH